MNRIIDTDELEKLQQYVMVDMTNGVEQCKHGDYVHIDDLRALIANSPQADGMVLVPSEPTEEMWEASNKYLDVVFNSFYHAYKAMLSAYKPQVDDVRKDAERYRWIRANPKLDICGTDEIAEFDAMIDRAMGKARE